MITSQDIADAFNAAGIDDTAKLAAAVSGFAVALKIKQIDIQIEALAAKRAAVLAPIQNEQIALLNERAALSDAIKPDGK